jgi:hypothetical protein
MARHSHEVLNMPRQKLRQLLDELRAELSASGDLDDEAREALSRLSDDIDRRISEETGAADAQQTPLEELSDATLRLEARHPRLAQLLGQIGDTLGKLGI